MTDPVTRETGEVEQEPRGLLWSLTVLLVAVLLFIVASGVCGVAVAIGHKFYRIAMEVLGG